MEEARVSTRQQLKDMAVSIQADFDRLQVQKESELKSILIAFAKIHMQYCEQVKSKFCCYGNVHRKNIDPSYSIFRTWHLGKIFVMK